MTGWPMGPSALKNGTPWQPTWKGCCRSWPTPCRPRKTNVLPTLSGTTRTSGRASDGPPGAHREPPDAVMGNGRSLRFHELRRHGNPAPRRKVMTPKRRRGRAWTPPSPLGHSSSHRRRCDRKRGAAPSAMLTRRALFCRAPVPRQWSADPPTGPVRAVLSPRRSAGRRAVQTVTLIFPCACPASRWRMASGTAASGYVRSSAGVTRPASISGRSASRSV
jgi:hypothetical protein